MVNLYCDERSCARYLVVSSLKRDAMAESRGASSCEGEEIVHLLVLSSEWFVLASHSRQNREEVAPLFVLSCPRSNLF